jgi:glucokinase
MTLTNILGIDVSEHGVRAVVVDPDGKVARSAKHLDADSAAAVRAAIAEATRGLSIDAAGFSVSHDQGDALASVIKSALSGIVPHRCSPGVAAVTAETWRGAAPGVRDVVALWIGDRVLAGILLDGRPWAGAHGFAGSAAWLALNPVERQDYRKFGSLAAEVSNTGIARRLAWRVQAGDSSAVVERAGDLDAITATHVFDGAREGDGVAISVVRDTAKYIGMAVANFAAAIDPDVVVLGGPVADAGDLLLEPVRQESARRLPPAMLEHFHVDISPFAGDGVAIGAARLAALAQE